MNSRIVAQGGAAVAVVAALAAFAPGAWASKLILRAPGVLPAGSPLTAVSHNTAAGVETCATVELTGVLLSNNKAHDKARFNSGTLSGCTAPPPINTVTTVAGGFPWNMKLSSAGVFQSRGTPREKWTDTFGVAPFTCTYQTKLAVNGGKFLVGPPTKPVPVKLEITPAWPVISVGSPECGPGTLEGTFELLSASKPVEAEK
jgi:hypothetical protein